MTCAEVRAALGAYVLGALDPTEAAAVREHLAGHAECRALYDDIAGMPKLLALVTPEEAERGLPQPSETGLRTLLRSARSERERANRRSRWMIAAASVAVLAVGVGALAAGRALAPDPNVALPTPAATPTRHFTSPPRTLAANDTTTQVNATLTMNPVAWGTELRLEMRGPGLTMGEVCALRVYDKSGKPWEAGSYRVAYRSGVRWTAGVWVPVDQIGRIEVIAHGYRKLVTIQA
jgi:anti-sigma factor RsiW